MRLLLDSVIADWSDEELTRRPLLLPQRSKLAALPVFEVSDAARFYWQTDKILDPVKGDMGRLRPGFQTSWWEFQLPDLIYSHADGWTETGSERYGAVVEAIENPGDEQNIDDPPLVLSLVLFGKLATNPASSMLPGRILVPLTEFGDWWRWRSGDSNALITGDPDAVNGLTIGARSAIMNLAETIFTGIGLSNAVNVTTQRVDVPPKVHAKRTRRAGAPTVSTYHVVHLPNVRHQHAVDRPSSSGDGARRAPAFVRGHVKTYSADRPLFGRVVGSYWWSPRVNDAGVQTIYSVGRKGERVLTPEPPPEGDPTP